MGKVSVNVGKAGQLTPPAVGGGGVYSYTPTLWVDAATGNDSNTYAQVAAGGGSVAWATIERAAWGSTTRASPNTSEAAQAGDVVSVAAGTYRMTGHPQNNDFKYNVWLNPANSGTSGNEIVFVADGTVDVGFNSGGYGPVFGSFQRDYIVWNGFYADEANCPALAESGAAVLRECSWCRLENCELDGNGDPSTGTNHCTKVQWSDNCTISDCLIYDYQTSGVSNANGAGILVYDCEDITFANNEIYGCGSGIFLKDNMEIITSPDNGFQFDIYNNFIHNCDHSGIAVHRYDNRNANVDIYRNLVVSCTRGLTLWGLSPDGPWRRSRQMVGYNVRRMLNHLQEQGLAETVRQAFHRAFAGST